MSGDNFIKNIISKDFNIFKNAIRELINSKDTALFEKLCDNCDFIFPNIKQKIIDNFVNLVNKNNLETVFLFSKIYCCDFEDIIIQSWLKFACEDLTDAILDLFQKGTSAQKTYCAKYFSKINDPLALDLLKQSAFDSYEPLVCACANALSAFCDREMIEKAKEIINSCDDEFKSLSAFQFLIAYGDEKLINYIVNNALKNPFALNIICYLKDFYSFETLKKHLNLNDLTSIFALICDNYPENISLDNIFQHEIFEFVKYLNSKENYNQYIENIFFIVKNKFAEYLETEVYNFDLDKNTKLEMENIVSYLSQINYTFQNLEDELSINKDVLRFEYALNVIKEIKNEKIILKLVDLINEKKLNLILLSQAIAALKELNKTHLIDKNITNDIENENIKALVLSLL